MDRIYIHYPVKGFALKTMKWVTAFIWALSSFSALADDRELRFDSVDNSLREKCRVDRGERFFIDRAIERVIERAAVQNQGGDARSPGMEFLVSWRDSDNLSREFQEKITQKTDNTNNKRLIIGQNNDVALQIASINPDAAYALHILGFFSKKVDHILPAKSEIRNKRSRTTAEVIEIIMGRNQQKSGQTDPNLTHLAQINQMPYELIEHADGQAFLVLGQRTVDQQGRVIRQAWPDVRVRLQWVPAGEAGYWQPVALENP